MVKCSQERYYHSDGECFMIANMNIIGLVLALAISIHPLFHIVIDKKYRCNNSNSLYLSCNLWSLLATNPLTITFCAGLAFYGILKTYFFCVIPLALLTWKLFIDDRFVSLSRGQGAPGYFCFLNVVTICLVLLSNESLAIKKLSAPLQAIILVEYGAIFLSAGAFKFFDCIKGNGMAFALGLINPMWSKIFRSRELIDTLSIFINFLGPSLQIIGGFLVMTGIRAYMATGYIIIGTMFILITPQTRLSWLCPSIASGAYINYLLMMSYESSPSSNVLFVMAVFVRLCVMHGLFSEHFLQKTSNKLIFLISFIYRKFLGVIIWKVFTFDLVKYICSRQCDVSDFRSIYNSSAKTNVYDSITLAALISSKKYISESDWKYRMHKALAAFNLELLQWINISDNNLSLKDNFTPFFNSKRYSYEIKKVHSSDLSDYSIGNMAYSLEPFSSYTRKIS